MFTLMGGTLDTDESQGDTFSFFYSFKKSHQHVQREPQLFEEIKVTLSNRKLT